MRLPMPTGQQDRRFVERRCCKQNWGMMRKFIRLGKPHRQRLCSARPMNTNRSLDVTVYNECRAFYGTHGGWPAQRLVRARQSEHSGHPEIQAGRGLDQHHGRLPPDRRHPLLGQRAGHHLEVSPGWFRTGSQHSGSRTQEWARPASVVSPGSLCCIGLLAPGAAAAKPSRRCQPAAIELSQLGSVLRCGLARDARRPTPACRDCIFATGALLSPLVENGVLKVATNGTLVRTSCGAT